MEDTMTIETKREHVEGIIYMANEDTIVDLWNCMCEQTGRDEEIIHQMSDVDEMFDGYSVREAHDEFDLCEFDWSDYWYVEGRCSTPRSSCDAEDLMDYSELVDYILDNDDDLGDPAIREVLDEPTTDTDDEDDHEQVEREGEQAEEIESMHLVELCDSEIDLILMALKAMRERCLNADNQRIACYVPQIERVAIGLMNLGE
jgi:hypothetical protein